MFSYADRSETLADIFRLLSNASYRFSLDEKDDVSIVGELDYIAGHEVKHVYCEPLT